MCVTSTDFFGNCVVKSPNQDGEMFSLANIGIFLSKSNCFAHFSNLKQRKRENSS
ncbi:hypothetical protein GCWU000325_00624 [Alloprevotella tannerae ATCC 51259]|uniref:Uncharacterized protein n=1 Tax=Alloprevotella tannerae ATCC 51259 TaxID=626522 RepID=C9LEJ4_9BACT|nr:hypothetical protein GCWU000325_00624 [Alloprevotella tannerae ATCC 51259]